MSVIAYNLVAFKETLYLRNILKGHAQVACVAAGLVTRGPDSLRHRLHTNSTERKCTSEVLGKPLSCGFTQGSPCSHLQMDNLLSGKRVS